MSRRSPLQLHIERAIEWTIYASGVLAIVLVTLIFLFLIKEGWLLFRTVPLGAFLGGCQWYPISEQPQFGVLPLICGTLVVTAGATVLAVPLSVGCAVYIAEVSPRWLAEWLKAGVELLAAIPSVVIGFVGMTFVAPVVKELFHLPTGLTAFTGALTLAFMAMPTIVSLTEDAITAVPRRYREAGLAVGATHWQTIRRIVLPAAAPGILAAVMLGIGRVIGETMAVMMITGNAAVIPHGILEPVRTLTATIAAEMGETVRGSVHYSALFGIGLILFVMTFIVNVAGDWFLHRRKVS